MKVGAVVREEAGAADAAVRAVFEESSMMFFLAGRKVPGWKVDSGVLFGQDGAPLGSGSRSPQFDNDVDGLLVNDDCVDRVPEELRIIVPLGCVDEGDGLPSDSIGCVWAEMRSGPASTNRLAMRMRTYCEGDAFNPVYEVLVWSVPHRIRRD